MTSTHKTMKRTGLLFAATLLALVVSSGVALAATVSCEAGVECFGTKQADTLNGSLSDDYMFGRGRSDTLKGFGGTDYLYGQRGADTLFGGSGAWDHLVGGPGNDTLSGEEGADIYYFGDGWGKDSIIDNTTTENRLAFVKGPAQDEQVPLSDDLIIKLVPSAGPEVKNASGTSTIDWEGANVIEDVFTGGGGDQITGNFAPNYIYANHGGGADTISAAGGNDEIHVDDGLGDDVVDCGETFLNPSDNDEVHFDSGDQIAENCETKLSAN
jgi:hypothetical protein